MGLRSAFNPLGALPYAAPASNGYTISWKVSNIPLNEENNYVLPESWLIDSNTVLSSDSSLHIGTVTQTSSGIFTVNMSYTVAEGTDPGSHTVTTTDTNYTVTQG